MDVTVTITADDLGLTGRVPARGYMDVSLYLPDYTVDPVVTTKVYRHTLVDGAATILAQSGDVLRFRPVQLDGVETFLFLIPAQATITYSELVATHRVEADGVTPLPPGSTAADLLALTIAAAAEAVVSADLSSQFADDAEAEAFVAAQAATDAGVAQVAAEAAAVQAPIDATAAAQAVLASKADVSVQTTVETGRLSVSGLSDTFVTLGDSRSALSAASIQDVLDSVPLVGTLPDHWDGETPRPIKATVRIPDGLYEITEPLRLPQGVELVLSDRAIVRAIAAMPYMIDTDVTLHHQDNGIYGGIWDCNDLADIAIWARWYGHFTVDVKQIRNTNLHGIVLGDPAATTSSFEGFTGPVHIVRPSDAPAPAGSIGIWVRRSTDTMVGTRKGTIIVGQDEGVRSESTSVLIDGVHVWGYPSRAQNGFATGLLPSKAFNIAGRYNRVAHCFADNIKAGGAGFYFASTAVYARMESCEALMDSQAEAPDNTAYGFYVESGAGVVALNTVTRGASAAKRYAANWAGTLTNVKLLGTGASDCVTVVSDTIGTGYNAWSTWTPVLKAATTDPTLGTGSTAIGRTRWDGSSVEFTMRIVFGTGAAAGSGSYSFALPNGVLVNNTVPNPVVGSGFIFDSSAGLYRQVILRWDNSLGRVFMHLDDSTFLVNSSGPWTWAAGDSIVLRGGFEVA